jgi:hypothetical protein
VVKLWEKRSETNQSFRQLNVAFINKNIVDFQRFKLNASGSYFYCIIFKGCLSIAWTVLVLIIKSVYVLRQKYLFRLVVHVLQVVFTLFGLPILGFWFTFIVWNTLVFVKCRLVSLFQKLLLLNLVLNEIIHRIVRAVLNAYKVVVHLRKLRLAFTIWSLISERVDLCKGL